MKPVRITGGKTPFRRTTSLRDETMNISSIQSASVSRYSELAKVKMRAFQSKEDLKSRGPLPAQPAVVRDHGSPAPATPVSRFGGPKPRESIAGEGFPLPNDIVSRFSGPLPAQPAGVRDHGSPAPAIPVNRFGGPKPGESITGGGFPLPNDTASRFNGPLPAEQVNSDVAGERSKRGFRGPLPRVLVDPVVVSADTLNPRKLDPSVDLAA
jgi:hypothetical protein